MTKAQQFFTPIGETTWSHISSPNKKFIKTGEYSIECQFSKNELLGIKASLDALIKEYINQLLITNKLTKKLQKSLIITDFFKSTSPQKLNIIAKQALVQNPGKYQKFILYSSSGEVFQKLTKEFPKATKVRLKLYPSIYFIKKTNTVGISFKINEIHALSDISSIAVSTSNLEKTVSAKIPMDIIAEFKKIKGEYFSIFYEAPTMKETITKAIITETMNMKSKISKNNNK